MAAAYYQASRVLRILISLGVVIAVLVRKVLVQRQRKDDESTTNGSDATANGGSRGTASEYSSSVSRPTRTKTLTPSSTLMIAGEAHTLAHESIVKPFWSRLAEGTIALALVVFIFSLDGPGVFGVWGSRRASALVAITCRGALLVTVALVFMRAVLHAWAIALPQHFESKKLCRKRITSLRIVTFFIAGAVLLWATTPCYAGRFVFSGAATLFLASLSVWGVLRAREYHRVHKAMTRNETYKSVTDQKRKAIQPTAEQQSRMFQIVVWTIVAHVSVVLSLGLVVLWCALSFSNTSDFGRTFVVHNDYLVQNEALWPAAHVADYSFEYWTAALVAVALTVFLYRIDPEQLAEPVFVTASVFANKPTATASAGDERASEEPLQRCPVCTYCERNGLPTPARRQSQASGASSSLPLNRAATGTRKQPGTEVELAVLRAQQTQNGSTTAVAGYDRVPLDEEKAGGGGAASLAPPTSLAARPVAFTGRESVEQLLATGVRLEDIPCSCQRKVESPLRLSPGELMMQTGGARSLRR